MTKHKTFHIVLILGSMQAKSNTAKVLGLVVDEIKKHEDITIEVIDPRELKLSFPGREDGETSQLLEKIVQKAAGVILATPEYHGSYSSVMKTIIENLGYPSVLACKPVALLGVASGQIGAIKALEHLSSVCAHVGAIVLPGPVSVAGVHKMFDQDGHCLNPNLEKRIRGLADTLINYIRTHLCPQVALEEMVRKEQV